MQKNLAKIDELSELHKFKGDHQNKEINKKIKRQMDNEKKLIDPKYIFEKKAKNNNNSKNSMRKPKELEQNKIKTIKEFNY
tara:strand:+ start:331 stop:573 length:243 start_codon:yes stop_codon:yes gene_type:complete